MTTIASMALVTGPVPQCAAEGTQPAGYELEVRTPEYAPAQFMRSFEDLARKSREVSPDTLPDLMARAHALAAVRFEGKIIAIAGVKRPNIGYRAKVFEKASLPDPGKYPYEIGWVYVEEGHRGHKLSSRLVDAVLARVGPARAYATSFEEHQAMHAALNRAGFHRAGEPYPSSRAGKKLLVFLRAEAAA